jgi:hypothetical protein
MALSKLNNWNAPLAAYGFPGDVFTGRPEATSGAAISVNIIASTHCTLTIEQSYNTSNWYYSNQLDISAGQLLTLQVPVVMPNFRVNVLNEEQVTQTYFNMNTSLVPQLTQDFNIRHLTPETDSVAVDLSGVTLEIGTTINVGNFPTLQNTYDASACLLLTDAVSVLTDISNNALVLPPVLDISGSVFVANFPAVQDTYDASANVLLAEVVSVLTDISNNGLILPPVLDISGSVFVMNFPAVQDTYDASANVLLAEAVAVLTDISNNGLTLPPVLDISGSVFVINFPAIQDTYDASANVLLAEAVSVLTDISNNGLALPAVLDISGTVLTNAIDIVLKSQVPLSSFAFDGGAQFGTINQLFTYSSASDPSNNPLSSIVACGIDDTAVDGGVRGLPLTNPYINPITYRPFVRSYIEARNKQEPTKEGSSVVSYGRGRNNNGENYQYLPLTVATNRNIVDVSANELYVKDLDVTTAVNTVADTLDSVIVTQSAVSVSALTLLDPPVNYKVVSVGNTDWRVLSASFQPTGAIDMADMVAQTRYVLAANMTGAQLNYGWDTGNFGGNPGDGNRNSIGSTFIYNGATLPAPMPTNFNLSDADFHNAAALGWTYSPGGGAPVFGADPSDFFTIGIDSNPTTFQYQIDIYAALGPWTEGGGTGQWMIPGSYFNGTYGNLCYITLNFSNPLAPEITIAGEQTNATDPIMKFFQSSVLVNQVFPATVVGTGTGTAVLQNASSVNVTGTVAAVLNGEVNVGTIGAGTASIGSTVLQSRNQNGTIQNVSCLAHFPPQFGGQNVHALYVNGFAYANGGQTIESNSSVSYGKDGNGLLKEMPLTTGGAEVKTSITQSLPAGSNAIGSVGLTASLNTATYNQAVTAGSFAGTTYTVGENSLVDVLLLATGSITSGTVRLEYSIDGTNWFPNNTTNYTISTADPHQTIIGLRTGSQYIRIGSVSTSTFRADNLNMTYSSKRN